MEQQTITPYLLYEDCAAALDWLTAAFGFEEELRHLSPEGNVWHASGRIGGGEIMMGDPGDHYRNPKRLGQETVGIYVVVDDVDAHFERAKEAGAEIREEPKDESYGHRRYTAIDPEGHTWYFASVLREVAAEEWGAQVATEA